MTSLDNHQSQNVTKLLLIGDSGTGKTGALASLVKAGYNLRILDFDNGLDILRNYLTREEQSRVRYKTLTDPMISAGGRTIVKGVPTAWTKAMLSLDDWKEGKGEDIVKLGPVTSWGSEDIIVIDSLTFSGRAAMRYVAALNGRMGQDPWQSDWGQAMEMQEGVLERLYASNVKCNVIVLSHITFQDIPSSAKDDDDATIHGYPSALGKKLPPRVGGYFNSVLMSKIVPWGTGAKYIIKTVAEPSIGLKNSRPSKVPAELPLGTGLAKFFELVKGAHEEEGS